MATKGFAGEMAASNQPIQFEALWQNSGCVRCGGLMVREFCMDLLNGNGEVDCPVARCVQCGDVVDPVIQRNRRLFQNREALSQAGLHP